MGVRNPFCTQRQNAYHQIPRKCARFRNRVIFDGVSSNTTESYDLRMLYFRKDGIDSGSGILPILQYGSPPSGDPIIRLHYTRGTNFGDKVSVFIRQEKWAYKFKLILSQTSNPTPSEYIRGMRMKAKIHPTAAPLW